MYVSRPEGSYADQSACGEDGRGGEPRKAGKWSLVDRGVVEAEGYEGKDIREKVSSNNNPVVVEK